MNRLAISIILLCVMAAGCTAAVFTVNSITDGMIEQISQVEQLFTDGETEQCKAAAKELQQKWDTFVKYSVLINDLGHAVEITSSISEIISFAEDENEEIYASCDRAQVQIKLFRQMQQPTLWKIL